MTRKNPAGESLREYGFSNIPVISVHKGVFRKKFPFVRADTSGSQFTARERDRTIIMSTELASFSHEQMEDLELMKYLQDCPQIGVSKEGRKREEYYNMFFV